MQNNQVDLDRMRRNSTVFIYIFLVKKIIQPFIHSLTRSFFRSFVLICMPSVTTLFLKRELYTYL